MVTCPSALNLYNIYVIRFSDALPRNSVRDEHVHAVNDNAKAKTCQVNMYKKQYSTVTHRIESPSTSGNYANVTPHQYMYTVWASLGFYFFAFTFWYFHCMHPPDYITPKLGQPFLFLFSIPSFCHFKVIFHFAIWRSCFILPFGGYVSCRHWLVTFYFWIVWLLI